MKNVEMKVAASLLVLQAVLLLVQIGLVVFVGGSAAFILLHVFLTVGAGLYVGHLYKGRDVADELQ